jgi:hypothetical protein
LRRSLILALITAVAIIGGATWIAWNNFNTTPSRTTVAPAPTMSQALILQLQNKADQSCKCARSNAGDEEKSDDCWNEFNAAVKTYDKINGPEAVAACVGWAANETLTFGPPVAKRREKERRYVEFIDSLTEKQKSVGYSIPPDANTRYGGEISDNSPEWTVTTRRINGGCSAQEEKKLAEVKKTARERKMAEGLHQAPSCG